MGYNAYEGKMVDMVATGIIDPVKVVRIALQVRPCKFSSRSLPVLLLLLLCCLARDA